MLPVRVPSQGGLLFYIYLWKKRRHLMDKVKEDIKMIDVKNSLWSRQTSGRLES